METIFPREEKADLLFDKILKDPEACERLMQTFMEKLIRILNWWEDIFHRNSLLRHCLMPIKPGSDSILMAVCKTACLTYCATHFWHRSALMRTDRINPYLLTDEDGNLIQTKEIHVSEKRL